MSGADWVPESMDELHDYVEEMRPRLAMTEQTREFIGFLAGDVEGEFGVGRFGQLDRRLGLAASMTLMPKWARHLTGTYQPASVRALVLEPRTRLQVEVTRWAYPELPCARLALDRAGARQLQAA